MSSPMRTIGAKWRDFAEGLGMQEEDNPAFVASQVQKELAEAERTDILRRAEAAKAERDIAEQKERSRLLLLQSRALCPCSPQTQKHRPVPAP
jgi:hypothetical protein